MYSRLAIAACIGTLTMSGVALWQYLEHCQTNDNTPALEITWPNMNLGNVPLGKHDHVITVSNQSAVPQRVLGMNEGCGSKYCINQVDADQHVILPGESVALTVRLILKSPGPISIPIVLLLDEHGQFREAKQTFVGHVVTSESPHAEP